MCILIFDSCQGAMKSTYIPQQRCGIDSWNESDMHGGAGILENAALTLDEPELEAIVIGNVNTSAITSESEVRSEAIDLEDDDICV